MSKIKSLADLKKIKENAMQNTNLRTTGDNPDRIVIMVGMATCGIAAGARVAMSAMLDEIATQKLDNISVVATGCIGMCYAEPLIEVRVPGQDALRYGNVTEPLARAIITDHIMQGKMLDNIIVGREVMRHE